MDRPKAIVGVIRGVAVDVSCLLWAGSGIYRVRYLRAVGYFSMSQRATGPARERKVCPRRSRMEGSVSLGYPLSVFNKNSTLRTSAPITPIRRLPGDSAPLGVINTAVTRGRMELHSRGGGEGQSARTNPPKKKNPFFPLVPKQGVLCRYSDLALVYSRQSILLPEILHFL